MIDDDTIKKLNRINKDLLEIENLEVVKKFINLKDDRKSTLSYINKIEISTRTIVGLIKWSADANDNLDKIESTAYSDYGCSNEYIENTNRIANEYGFNVNMYFKDDEDNKITRTLVFDRLKIDNQEEMLYTIESDLSKLQDILLSKDK